MGWSWDRDTVSSLPKCFFVTYTHLDGNLLQFFNTQEYCYSKVKHFKNWERNHLNSNYFSDFRFHSHKRLIDFSLKDRNNFRFYLPTARNNIKILVGSQKKKKNQKTSDCFQIYYHYLAFIFLSVSISISENFIFLLIVFFLFYV